MTKRRKQRERERFVGAGLFLLIAGALSFVSLIVYLDAGAPQDVGGASSGFVGELGLAWGRAQVWLCGYPALALTLVVAYVGLELLRGAWERLGRRIFGFLLLVFSLAWLFGFVGRGTEELPWHGYGGVVGVGAAEGVVESVGSLGTVLLALVVLLLGFTLATGIRISAMGRGLAAGGRWAAERVGSLFKNRVRPRLRPETPPSFEKPSPSAEPSLPTETVPEEPPRDLPEWQQPGISPVLEPPPLELLGLPTADEAPIDQKERIARERALDSFFTQNRVAVKVVDYDEGPSLGRFELRLAPGTRIAALERLKPELELALGCGQVRLAPNPERGTVALEVPLSRRRMVRLRELLEEPAWQRHESPLAFPVGLTQDGRVVVADLAELPHLLIAGTTGSGKSVFLNAMLVSLLFRVGPRHLQLVLIDPGRVELVPYEGLPHLLTPPVCEPYGVLDVLGLLVGEMEQRYNRLSAVRCRSIAAFNDGAVERGDLPMPYIVVFVDELAELMAAAGKSLEQPLARLAQMARAAGIHLVVATQRPSVDVVTGVIKANFPSRIAFKVRSATDSRVILDRGGAEGLAGSGDLLFLPVGESEPLRLQGGFVDEAEIDAVVAHWAGTSRRKPS